MKDYLLLSDKSNTYLNWIVSLAHVYLDRGKYPEAGGYLDQPSFFMNHVVTWVDEGLRDQAANNANRAALGQ